MAERELVIGTFVVAVTVSCILGGIESDAPLQLQQGQPITIECRVADKPSLPRLEWVFTNSENVSKVIGERGNQRVRRISDTLLELELQNATSNHTGLYACRDQNDKRKSRTEMSFHIIVTDSGPVPVTCSSQMFRCGDLCIASRFRCDRVVDCIGDLDELDCPTECNVETEFRCENGQCIEAEYVCDKFHGLDCRDGSDESHCPDRHYVYTGQVQAVGTGEPPHVLAYESRNWQVHGIYSVVAGVFGLVCVVTIIVITICRIHMRRDAQLAMMTTHCTRTRTISTRSTRSTEDSTRLAAVAVFIQAGPPPTGQCNELTGLVVSPPPYSELTDTPPPYEEAVVPDPPPPLPPRPEGCSPSTTRGSPRTEEQLQRVALLQGASQQTESPSCSEEHIGSPGNPGHSV